MNDIVDQALGQLLALLAFFAFPIVQYVLLRRIAHREARPELWYLPAFGFRLVIRNLPRKKTMTDIRYRAIIRKVVARSSGASVATFVDELLLEREDFFLFPGSDQVLVAFRLTETGENSSVALAKVNKLGEPEGQIELQPGDRLICDYSAMIDNFFNFDVGVARRVEITGESLRSFAASVQEHADAEMRFPVDRVRSVG